MVLSLLEAGAEPNDVVSRASKSRGGASSRPQAGWTALHRSAHAGHAAAVTALLRHGSDKSLRTTFSGDTALHLAAKGGHTSAVRQLVHHRADPGC